MSTKFKFDWKMMYACVKFLMFVFVVKFKFAINTTKQVHHFQVLWFDFPSCANAKFSVFLFEFFIKTKRIVLMNFFLWPKNKRNLEKSMVKIQSNGIIIWNKSPKDIWRSSWQLKNKFRNSGCRINTKHVWLSNKSGFQSNRLDGINRQLRTQNLVCNNRLLVLFWLIKFFFVILEKELKIN